MSASTAQQRTQALDAALAVHGCVRRGDSSLCRAFIEGTTEASYTAESVAYTVALHRLLYEHTDYSQRCRQILPQLATQLAPSLGSWQAAWNYVREHESPLIKAAVLAEMGGIPSKWPWMVKNTWHREIDGRSKAVQSEDVVLE